MATRIYRPDFAVDLRRVSATSKAIRLDGGTNPHIWWPSQTPTGPGTLSVGRVDRAELHCEAWGPGASWLLEQVPRLVGADDDPESFEAPDGPIRDLARRGGIRRFGRTDRYFESMLENVLGQRVQTVAAHESLRALVRSFGEPAPGPHEMTMFPSPERVAAMGYHEFHRFNIERKRADIIIGLAKRANRLEEVADLSIEDGYRRLQAFRGVGIWTASNVMGAARGDADAIPIGDFHVKNLVSWALAGEPRGTDERMIELLEPYRPHRGRVLELLKGAGVEAPRYGAKLSIMDIRKR